MRTILPEVGQRISIMIGSRKVVGRCVSNECRAGRDDRQNGLKKGDVVAGLGIMREDKTGHQWWLRAGQWEHDYE